MLRAIGRTLKGPIKWFAGNRIAKKNGTLVFTGLKNTVKIFRDKFDVPHVYASNLDDLFFAQVFLSDFNLHRVFFTPQKGYFNLK